MAKKSYILLGLLVSIFLTGGCVLQKDQGIDETEFVEKREEKNQINTVTDKLSTAGLSEKEIALQEKVVDLSKSFVYNPGEGGYGTVTVTGYAEAAQDDSLWFNYIESNNLEFLNYRMVEKEGRIYLGCMGEYALTYSNTGINGGRIDYYGSGTFLMGDEYEALLNSSKTSPVKLRLTKSYAPPTLAAVIEVTEAAKETDQCFTKYRDIKIIE